MQKLNVIGGGKLGRSLARLFREREIFEIGGVLSRSVERARDAVEWIGGGQAVSGYSEFMEADAWMISVADRAIPECAALLAESGKLRTRDIVFHCSGAHPSSMLAKCREAGAAVGSLHPARSFPEPLQPLSGLEGVVCSIEGDAAAAKLLRQAASQADAIAMTIRPDDKILYHAACVFANNFTVSVLYSALKILREAGYDDDAATRIIGGLSRTAVESFVEKGPIQAISGPVARGESVVLRDEIAALMKSDEKIAGLFRMLGGQALELTEQRGDLSAERLAELKSILEK